jgi:hypothetical protein
MVQYAIPHGDVVKQLCLDMDGLLTDFQREMLRLHQPHGLVYTDVNWNFWAQMGKTEKEFWQVADFNFWSKLPWCPEGESLLTNIERIVGRKNICLLSSPGVGSMDGKEHWINAHIPEYNRQFMFGREKWRMADQHTLLVDDSDQNCIEFKNSGGHFVLVPRPWNLYRSKTNKDGTFKMRPVLAEIREWWEK